MNAFILITFLSLANVSASLSGYTNDIVSLSGGSPFACEMPRPLANASISDSDRGLPEETSFDIPADSVPAAAPAAVATSASFVSGSSSSPFFAIHAPQHEESFASGEDGSSDVSPQKRARSPRETADKERTVGEDSSIDEPETHAKQRDSKRIDHDDCEPKPDDLPEPGYHERMCKRRGEKMALNMYLKREANTVKERIRGLISGGDGSIEETLAPLHESGDLFRAVCIGPGSTHRFPEFLQQLNHAPSKAAHDKARVVLIAFLGLCKHHGQIPWRRRANACDMFSWAIDNDDLEMLRAIAGAGFSWTTKVSLTSRNRSWCAGLKVLKLGSNALINETLSHFDARIMSACIGMQKSPPVAGYIMTNKKLSYEQICAIIIRIKAWGIPMGLNGAHVKDGLYRLHFSKRKAMIKLLLTLGASIAGLDGGLLTDVAQVFEALTPAEHAQRARNMSALPEPIAASARALTRASTRGSSSYAGAAAAASSSATAGASTGGLPSLMYPHSDDASDDNPFSSD